MTANILSLLAVATWALTLLSPTPSFGCDDGGLCIVDRDGRTLGEYRVRPPETDGAKPIGDRPAILFIHGWRGSSKNVVRLASLRRFADSIGAVLIAPEGLSSTWSYPGSPARDRDEIAFFDALRRDVVARHSIDPDRILVSGFSMGASMAWSLACDRGEAYWGFVTFSGAFWEPLPARCASPARRFIHIHGDADRTAPIEGRPIGRLWRQADVTESLKILLAASKLEPTREQSARLAGMDCERWGGGDRLIQFCRHESGHFWRAPWLKAAYEALKAR